MLAKIKTILKKCVPLSIRIWIGGWFYGFRGPYGSWQEALEKSTGYDNSLILEKVKTASLKVARGEAAYERDSVTFDQTDYSWPILASLLLAGSENNNKLNVLDFGGSLGSSYYQYRPLLSHLQELSWSVVEQKNFADYGQKNLSNKELGFYSELDDCLRKENPDIVLFSSSIQYLEKPYQYLQKILDQRVKFVVFDRTSFSEDMGRDTVAVQKVPPQIYQASYPCWFFDKPAFIKFFSPTYKLLAEFECPEGRIRRGRLRGIFKGLLFKLEQ